MKVLRKPTSGGNRGALHVPDDDGNPVCGIPGEFMEKSTEVHPDAKERLCGQCQIQSDGDPTAGMA